MRCYDSCCQPDPGITSVILGHRRVGATRVPHRCADCSGAIPVGSPSWVFAGLIDGEFWSGYQHSANGLCTAGAAGLS
jgi:hypothetical protein